MLEELLKKELKKEGISLSVPEVICLAQSFHTPNENIKLLAQKSIYTYEHLLFNLNKLERKNFIDLKADSKMQKELFVSFTNKGKEAINLLKHQRIILYNTPKNFDILKEEISQKLK